MKRIGPVISCVIIGICLVLFLGLLWIANIIDNRQTVTAPPTEARKEECSIALNPIEGEVYLVNNAVVEWMKGEHSAKALYNALREDGRLDTPLPAVLPYAVENIPAQLSIVSQIVEVSEHEDFSNARVVSVEPQHRRAIIYNLCTNRNYYYRVTVTLSDGQQVSAQSTFKTADTPRFIQIDGVRGCRDIGGHRTMDGKVIRQGMIYRGTELDAAISNKYEVTEAGVQTMLNELNIRTEMDLRASSTPGAKDMLGASVGHPYFTFLSYNESFTDHGKRKVKEIFTMLADEEIYPLYFHCTYGADRTGTICYLLEAVLGLSEEDLYREWELSAFLVGGAFEEDMAMFVETLRSYEGETMPEKVENYLLSIGVTIEEMNSIREIMLIEE